ncbi:MAG: hypothetical protein ABI332_02310 [Polyangiaceae bacterium]
MGMHVDQTTGEPMIELFNSHDAFGPHGSRFTIRTTSSSRNSTSCTTISEMSETRFEPHETVQLVQAFTGTADASRVEADARDAHGQPLVCNGAAEPGAFADRSN